MPEQVVRFVVGDRNTHRASTWRCWNPAGQKTDIYLAPRSIAASFKVSLHESGDWRVALTEKYEQLKRHDGRWNEQLGRLLARWPRPQQIASGTTLAFRVLVPSSSVTIPSAPEVLPGELVWIPPPPPAKVVEVSLLITNRDPAPDSWPGKRAMKTLLVGKLALANGDIATIVHRTDDLPDMTGARRSAAGFVARLRSELREDLLERHDEFRFLVAVPGDPGPPEALMEYKFTAEDLRGGLAEPSA